ncbi:hypothetical protein [Devosia sp. YR412]|uniref:hypothetical protein n=1 Tax=Devosia sp. YR412 TaxID=1881030 RepID=UPI00147DBD06|nr:hypothetical protein [Devosia sp. YR412]
MRILEFDKAHDRSGARVCQWWRCFGTHAPQRQLGAAIHFAIANDLQLHYL